MSKFAPVAPPQMLRKLKNYDMLGDYHLLLAHDVVKQHNSYAGLFNPTDTLIMDNSVIELGSAVDFDISLKAAELVGAKIVVLPDVIGNAHETLEIAHAVCFGRDAPEGVKYMAVPQGRSPDEYMFSVQHLAEMPNIEYWGIPRDALRFGLTTREPLIDVCSLVRPDWPIHLLGFSNDLDNDMYCAKQENVMGIDSAVPLRMGQADQLINLYQKDHSPRGTFWEDESDAKRPLHKMTLRNIYCVRQWCKGLNGVDVNAER